MTTTNKIELYLANNLEELNKRADDNPFIQKAKLSNCAQITHVIETTWAEAKKAESSYDEERAYILYMRLFTCFTALKQAKDIANNQSSVQYYQKGALIWLEKADQLSASLKARYDAKNEAKLEEERKKQAVIEEENSLKKSIVPKLLYKYLNERKKNILLIDMRSKVDYDRSHMKTSACIHIPIDLMNGKGWTSWGVESALTDQNALTKFKQRANFDYIILFDEDTYENNLKAGHCLMGLKQAIFSFDRDIKLKHEPLILDGGYEDWMIYYPGESTAPLISKKNIGELRSFEVSYPDDVYISQEVPSDAATAAQPEAAIIPPAIVPQIDRTRKPINYQKPESSVIEQQQQQELPIKQVEEQPTPTPTPTPTTPVVVTNEQPTSTPTPPVVLTKEQPEIPDRSMKPVPPSAEPSSSVSEELPITPIVPDISLRPSSVAPIISNTNITPEISKHPKPIDTNENKNDSNRENIPPKETSKFSIPNRETLPIYRPFNRTASINNTNEQYKKKFDAVTGRKIILDTKTNQYVTDIPENETNKISNQITPTINRETKPILTEQTRYQMAYDYRAIVDNLQINCRAGLKNLGNSCYMNSIIQSLSFNFILTNYFLKGDFFKEINTKNKFGSGGLVVKEWFKLMYMLWCQQYSYIAPQPFKYIVGTLQHAYLGTQQQDAHEFLVFLLDSLHEDLNQATRPRFEELKSENYKNDRQLAEASKQAFLSHNKSIIIDLFYGLFKSTTICLSCTYNSIRFDAFAIISVPIPPVRQCSLDDCLDLFREFEHLTGEERYECSNCKRLSAKKRRLDIWELPKIFIVHFKRFRLQQTHYIKNETLIRYPISNVDFSDWSQIPSPSKYSLISVVNHFGSMNSGHYTSYCNDGKQWYYCDDQSIRAADVRELANNVHAYLLFYSSIPQQQLRLPLITN
ncbi:unnamed protein product [Rotaria sordida]|uniref:Ubiquitin carboxyl-terminal hydrolase n=1 Tax=Rotaria sordida TaxID=392033 RepID=A0A813RDY5_9BILA|nr:unnamed protein product [Rotaria sordida]CAF3558265.1 unnamed protein product [Rotaria sordida]